MPVRTKVPTIFRTVGRGHINTTHGANQMAKNTQKDPARGKRVAQGMGAAVAEREDARPQLREDAAPATFGQGADLPNAPVGEGPSGDDIARRAYELYLERGGTEGESLQDWLRAEEELTGR